VGVAQSTGNLLLNLSLMSPARCLLHEPDGHYNRWLSSQVVRRSRAWVPIAARTLSGNSLRQTVHTHRASVHQAAKLVAALLRVARITAA